VHSTEVNHGRHHGSDLELEPHQKFKGWKGESSEERASLPVWELSSSKFT
jgi:hypothetical protein